MPKTKRRTSPTQRTLAQLRKIGAHASVVEKRLPKCFITQDCFGFMDILAVLGPNIIGIQVTSGPNHAARRSKILAEPRALAWLKAGGLIEVHSWRKAGARGQVKKWQCWKEEIVATDFALSVE